jgi:hypothetical protein
MFATGTATDYADLLERLHTFLTGTGSAFGLTYAGTGNGTLTGYKGGSASVAETFTITATSATAFTVVGSVSGSLAGATVGTPYTGTKVQFTLTAGGTAFVAGDVFTLSTAPAWTTKRRMRGALVTPSAGTTGQYAGENVNDGKRTADSSRNWQVSNPVFPLSIEFQFYENETIAEYAIMPTFTGSYDPSAWTFDYWNGSAWVTLDTRTGLSTGWAAGSLRAFTVASPVAATRYRINFTAGTSSLYLQIDAIELRRAPGDIPANFGQYLWQAPGNGGADQIFVGAHPFRRTDTDYFNWELAAFDGHSASATFYDQPGAHVRMYLPLWNSTIPYWFVADGRRVIVVAKVSGNYEVAYLGFYDPFFTPAQMPYPMCLGGSMSLGVNQPVWNDSTLRWSTTTYRHRAFTHSDANNASTGVAMDCQLRARRLDGVWAGYVAAFSDNPAQVFSSSWPTIWPYAGDLNQLDANLDGSYALWPVMLLHAAPNPMGQLSGVSAVTGQGTSAESLIRAGAVDHLVVPNISRTDRNDFLAVRLD